MAVTVVGANSLPSDLLKTDVIKLRVQQGIYSLFPKENVRSVVWQRFRGILNEFGEEIFGVSCCYHCHTCIRYKSAKNGKIKDFGTKNLRDHIVYCGVPRKKGRKEKRNDLDNLPQEIEEIADFKFNINNQQGCQAIVPSTSVITELVGADGRAVEGGTEEETICKVENLDDEFLDEINSQVSHMSNSTTSAEASTSSSKNEEGFISPTAPGASFRRIRILGVQPPPTAPTSATALASTSSEASFPPMGYTTPASAPSCSSSLSSSSSCTPPAEVAREDEHDVFGRHVANELRSLPGDANRRWARFQIQKVLFDAHSCHNT